MTQNQIEYSKAKEVEYHNRVTESQAEQELARKRQADQETARHNLASEGLTQSRINTDIQINADQLAQKERESKRTAKTSKKVARINKSSAKQAAKISAKAQTTSAQTAAKATVAAADINRQGQITVADLNNQTKKWIESESPQALASLKKVETETESITESIERANLDSESQRDLNKVLAGYNNVMTYVAQQNGKKAAAEAKKLLAEAEDVHDRTVSMGVEADAAYINAMTAQDRASYQNTADQLNAISSGIGAIIKALGFIASL